MGVAAPVLQPGDVIWILFGVRFPVILRPVTGRATFTYVCLSYIHGDMHG
jgi:hypothetical protein